MDNNNFNNGYENKDRNAAEDYNDPDKYNYNPYTGERNVRYTYEDARYNETKPKRRVRWWIPVICIASALAISLTSIIAYVGLSRINEDTKQNVPANNETETYDNDESEQTKDEPNIDLKFNTNSAALKDIIDSNASLTDIAKKTIKSVVCIENYQNIGSRLPFANGNGASSSTLASEGSGVIINDEGYVITNQHVINGSDMLKVIMSTGEIYDAELIGEDEVTDLALMKITPEEKVKFVPITIGDSDSVEIASYVMAVGNPGGYEFSSSVTLGIISATNRPITISSGYTINMLQTDAAINPGNSGGALVDMSGRLIGISSAKYVAQNYENMGFAITVNEAIPIVEELAKYGYVKDRGTLSAEYQVIDASMAQYYNVPQGLYVTSVSGDCGTLKAGCIITEIDNKAVRSEGELSNALSGKEKGDSVSVKYYDMNTKEYGETTAVLVESEMTVKDSDESGNYDDYYQYYYGNGNGYGYRF